jgi:hypothetical protein
LSYSYGTGIGENASDINKKTEPDNPNNIAMEIARDELNESLEFSNFDDESKSKSSPTRKTDDLDSEYRKKLQKVEEDLETKFASILADLETQYQNEARRIQNNLDIELKNLKENTFGSTEETHPTQTTDSVERKKHEIEQELQTEHDQSVRKQLDQIKKDGEKKVSELEEDLTKEIERNLAEMRSNHDLELINQRRVTPSPSSNPLDPPPQNRRIPTPN